MGVWVCGCVGVWVCGCVGVWVCGWVGSLVAQWLAQCAATPEVGGSNPTRGKKKQKRCMPSLQHLLVHRHPGFTRCACPHRWQQENLHFCIFLCVCLCARVCVCAYVHACARVCDVQNRICRPWGTYACRHDYHHDSAHSWMTSTSTSPTLA